MVFGNTEVTNCSLVHHSIQIKFENWYQLVIVVTGDISRCVCVHRILSFGNAVHIDVTCLQTSQKLLPLYKWSIFSVKVALNDLLLNVSSI